MEIGTVRMINIEDEMQAAYLDYAMSVITARALPDVRDGLKPVQRRILYAMDQMGLSHDKPYKKSARIVGDVLGRYHPHGDQAVYDALVRMAQDFSMRYTLVDGQGNFGSIDGDPAAAMRYTEARLHKVAEELLVDIDKNTVDFNPNFDGSMKEPDVLPARLPNLLLNGASGIAVGMATNIPPHNLGELCDALIHLIDHYDKLDGVTVDELIKLMPGPDFPTGGSILGVEGIRNAYVTGQGRIVMRAKAHIEDMKGGRERIVVTELPYQVNKATLIERIADLVRNRKIETISDLRDESDRRGMHVVVELKRGAESRTTLNQLLKYTQLQQAFNVNMLALVEGAPVRLGLKRALQHWIDHRREVIRRRSEFELEKAKARAHILEGLRIALANLDEVIKTIRESPDADMARQRLMKRFKLTEIQAQAILDMQLRRLAALERRKIDEEYAQIVKEIARLEDLLANPRKILSLIRGDCEALKKEYGDPRRTRITEQETETFREEDLIPQEDVLITITQRGYIKRVPASSYRPQKRGGRGVAGVTSRDENEPEVMFLANTRDTVLFFSNLGKVYSQQVHQLPDADRQAKGVPLSTLVPLDKGERITAALPVPNLTQAEYIVMATTRGKIKRLELKEFESVRPSGIIATNLDAGDELGWARLTHGKDEVILVTEQGQALRFGEDELRPMGRNAAGVNAIKLARDDRVTSMDVVQLGAELLVVTKNGYGKRTPLSEYAAKGRYTGGIRTIDPAKLRTIGPVASARVVHPSDEITILASDGMVLRTWAESVPAMSRAARGDRVIDLAKGATVVTVARLAGREGPEGGAGPGGKPSPDGSGPPGDGGEPGVMSGRSARGSGTAGGAKKSASSVKGGGTAGATKKTASRAKGAATTKGTKNAPVSTGAKGAKSPPETTREGAVNGTTKEPRGTAETKRAREKASPAEASAIRGRAAAKGSKAAGVSSAPARSPASIKGSEAAKKSKGREASPVQPGTTKAAAGTKAPVGRPAPHAAVEPPKPAQGTRAPVPSTGAAKASKAEKGANAPVPPASATKASKEAKPRLEPVPIPIEPAGVDLSAASGQGGRTRKGAGAEPAAVAQGTLPGIDEKPKKHK